MADFTAIAAITRTLAQVIQDGITRCDGDIARATVTTARPDRSEGNAQPRVNLFMFHASPNPYVRNQDLPVVGQNGLLHRPSIALDLFYLASFYGNDDLARSESQILMGITMATLNAHPVFTSEAIRRAGASFDSPPDPRFDIGQVQITLQNLSVEELARLWGTFPLVPYTPSICYRASPILIEADEVPLAALPVQAVSIGHPSLVLPQITSVRGAAGGPPVFGQAIAIGGRHLAGAEVRVRLGDAVLPAEVQADGSVTVQTVDATVAAGVQALQVESGGQLSPRAPVALAPLLVGCRAEMQSSGRREVSGTVEVQLQPAVQPQQAVVLELFPVKASLFDLRRSYRFEWARRPETLQGNLLRLPVKGVGEGSYIVRITIDGAPSLLSQDAKGHYTGPVLSVAPSTSEGSPS